MHQPKIDPADQLGAVCLSGADRSFRLSECRDVRPKRYDATQHERNRAEHGDLAGCEQAKHHDKQQGDAAADRYPGRQDDLPAPLGGLGKRFDPRLYLLNLVGIVGRVVFGHRTGSVDRPSFECKPANAAT